MLGSQALGKNFWLWLVTRWGKCSYTCGSDRAPLLSSGGSGTKVPLHICLSVRHLVSSEVARLLTKHPLCGFSTNAEEIQGTHISILSQELGLEVNSISPLSYVLMFLRCGGIQRNRHLARGWVFGCFVCFTLLLILQKFKPMNKFQG